MSIESLQSFDQIGSLISQFGQYNNIFDLVFFKYNGKTQTISLHYRLRTLNSFSDDKIEFIQNLIEQYLKNPIQIPGNLYNIDIHHQSSFDNLAQDNNYCQKIEKYYIFNLTNLIEIDSDYVDILIETINTINFENLVEISISKEPKTLEKNKKKMQITCLLKNNNFPERFQCINIPINFNFNINQILEIYIPNRMLKAYVKWMNLAGLNKRNTRKIRVYEDIIRNKYKITPLEFGKRINQIIDYIVSYFIENFNSVVKIRQKKGHLTIETPKGAVNSNSDGSKITFINFNFISNFDNNNLIIQSELILKVNWMRKIVAKYLTS